MNVLIIEDDYLLTKHIKDAFFETSFANRVEHIASYKQYIYNFPLISSFDIILLDINLGKNEHGKGFQILDSIRKYNTTIPVIIISSHSSYHFLEEAFARGAHDYLIKPFRFRELEIRILRWFRNYVFSEYYAITKELEYEELIYNVAENNFYIVTYKISLSKGSKYLLSLLFIQREKLVRSDFLIEKIWGYYRVSYENNLRIKIMRLKKQLKTHNIDLWIQTIRGEGYVLKKN